MASASSSMAAEERERKRKRASVGEPQLQPPSKWRTRREHEIYSSKLLEALRLVRAGGIPARGRAVRYAADRALAVAARGRSRWSRTVLASRACCRRALRVRLRAPATPASPTAASSSPSARQPALARKARVLRRLVPGCRKLPFPALLAEVSDYIAALEMQVRAMTALAQVLTSVSASAPGGSSSPA